MMGGEADQIGVAEARSALAWWLEAGVDVAVGETPRNWLSEAPKPAAPDQGPPSPTPIPDDFEAFRTWLAESHDLPAAESDSPRVLPVGAQDSPLMIITDAPAAEEVAAGRPIGGECWVLAQRMLAAIAIAPDEAYLASISCLYSPATKLSESQLSAWGEIARRHVALARPKRLLLFGDAPAKALLGRPLATARGHVYKTEGVRTVATFHPRLLISQPARKADAWRDLLLLMEDEV